jgi:hypothetical protein
MEADFGRLNCRLRLWRKGLNVRFEIAGHIGIGGVAHPCPLALATGFGYAYIDFRIAPNGDHKITIK